MCKRIDISSRAKTFCRPPPATLHLSIERFESLGTPGKLLSLSFWRDEQAVAAWRNLESHRKAQALGRDSVFEGYRLRVASVLRDYGMAEREEAPQDSRVKHG